MIFTKQQSELIKKKYFEFWSKEEPFEQQDSEDIKQFMNERYNIMFNETKKEEQQNQIKIRQKINDTAKSWYNHVLKRILVKGVGHDTKFIILQINSMNTSSSSAGAQMQRDSFNDKCLELINEVCK